MRSILGLTLALVVLLLCIGPERGPVADCAVDQDQVCLGEGRLQVRVRGAHGRALGGGVAGFGFEEPEGLEVVVRVESVDSLERTPPNLGPASDDTAAADRIFISSLSERELWVEVTDIELSRTRVYHRPAGPGWGLVDVVPRTIGLQVAAAR